MFDWIKSDWAILQNPEEVNIIKKYAIKSKNITIFMIVIFYVFLFVMISMYTIPTLLDIVLPLNETRRHKCPFPIETFYNIEDTTVGHILVTFIATTLGVIGVSIYSSFLLVMYHACGMLSITGYILEHAFLGNDQYVSTNKECEMIHKKIVRSVRVHIRAIKFFENIKDISEVCYSVQIGLALVLVAADYIKLMLLDKETLMKNMSNTIALFLHGIGILFSLFINCHAGQEVINHSTDVFHKATVAPWYLASKRTQKSAILILMRSQIPCYVGLLKTSMSYATVCYTIQ
ncbi:hypothetical protein KPH14_007668 [Odynerus spinipes]|uniref:Odorant receptor n=1 Tax=Odynerus spinipes TaxID=1348599 RepID=A0AAD9VMY4_9HYME|nr:hypothetical protein KPH14_007668 [Odynerus spinipes]